MNTQYNHETLYLTGMIISEVGGVILPTKSEIALRLQVLMDSIPREVTS